ncbi:MAG: hypothetical protein GY796_05880 [Chloroflexi bacterium]|nr:hypothetical protein [Chloroflexota bacterium]
MLDFANSEEEIVESFQPFYEKTTLTATTDPNKLYDLKTQLDEYQIIRPAEVDAFTRVFFKPQRMGSKRDHGLLNSFIDPAVDRYRHLEDEEKQDDFKNTLTVFVRLYAFLAQIMPFADVELEKLYAYNRLLLTKLPKQNQGERLKLEDEVALEYYRLQKIKEGSIDLQKNGDAPLDPVSEAGTRREKEERARLSEIIEVLNDRFGTEFVAADKLFFDQVEEELAANETLSQQAKSNTIENFRYGFEEEFLNALIGRMDKNQEIFAKILDDAEFGDTVREWMLKKVYQRLNEDVDVELE